MGRKASFRDTTQIDRREAILSFYRFVINVRFYGRVAFFRKLGSVFRKGPTTALSPIAALLESGILGTLSVIAPIMIHYYTIIYARCQYFLQNFCES